MKRVIAFDPGLNGAWAVLDASGLVALGDMPAHGDGAQRRVSGALIRALIDAHEPSLAVVEAVSARPGQGVSSMFRFGRAVGVVDGVLGACGLPVRYAAPTTWKRAMSVTADKNSARARAVEMFPGRAREFERVKDADRAEAALIARYAIEQGWLV